mmetsp:Transcript_60352/g.168626  ORF Transcript_60352/g.168626 Transcript_60352/m.168626 type:complete len:241 (+) Transcript_60352:405-1127(+)
MPLAKRAYRQRYPHVAVGTRRGESLALLHRGCDNERSPCLVRRIALPALREGEASAGWSPWPGPLARSLDAAGERVQRSVSGRGGDGHHGDGQRRRQRVQHVPLDVFVAGRREVRCLRRLPRVGRSPRLPARRLVHRVSRVCRRALARPDFLRHRRPRRIPNLREDAGLHSVASAIFFDFEYCDRRRLARRAVRGDRVSGQARHRLRSRRSQAIPGRQGRFGNAAAQRGTVHVHKLAQQI